MYLIVTFFFFLGNVLGEYDLVETEQQRREEGYKEIIFFGNQGRTMSFSYLGLRQKGKIDPQSLSMYNSLT